MGGKNDQNGANNLSPLLIVRVVVQVPQIKALMFICKNCPISKRMLEIPSQLHLSEGISTIQNYGI